MYFLTAGYHFIIGMVIKSSLTLCAFWLFERLRNIFVVTNCPTFDNDLDFCIFDGGAFRESKKNKRRMNEK